MAYVLDIQRVGAPRSGGPILAYTDYHTACDAAMALASADASIRAITVRSMLDDPDRECVLCGRVDGHRWGCDAVLG